MRKETIFWIIPALLTVIIYSLLFQYHAGAFPRNVKWRQVRTDHFVIVFAPQHRSMIEYVAQMAESVHRDIANVLNYTEDLKKTTYVVITDEKDTFNPYALNIAAEEVVVLVPGQPEQSMMMFWRRTRDRLFQQFIAQYSSILRHKTDRWLQGYVTGIPFPDAGFSGWMDGGIEPRQASPGQHVWAEAVFSPETRYNPIPSLIPGVLPMAGEDEDGWQIGVMLSGQDYLEQHEYWVSLLYGLESGRAAFEAAYLNTQYSPNIQVFGYDNAERYTNLFLNHRAEETDYWERRQGGGIDVNIPLCRFQRTELSLITGYEYTQFAHLTDMDELFPPGPDEGTLASVSAGVILKSFDPCHYSVSPESGVFILAEYKRDDEIFGSDFNIHQAVGEINLSLNSFFQRHVLAVKLAGGLSDGDTLKQGVFQLGGYFLHVEPDFRYEPEFSLRGYAANTFAGDRIVIGTVEYHFPIWFPQRTLWNGRILWDSITAAAFFEGGDAWEHHDDRELQYSAGAELNMRLGFHYGRMPVTFGVGFTQGFDQDDGESQIYFNLKLDMSS